MTTPLKKFSLGNGASEMDRGSVPPSQKKNIYIYIYSSLRIYSFYES
jgi:hypothetical protein